MPPAPKISKPHLQQQISGSWLLWFKKSNRYAVLPPDLKRAVEVFFESSDKAQFARQLKHQRGDLAHQPETLYQEVEDFLTASAVPFEGDLEEKRAQDADLSCCTHTMTYAINRIPFRIHAQSQTLQELVHYPIANYRVTDAAVVPHSEFWLYEKNDALHLFQDGCLVQAVRKDQTHYIRGKFTTRLISLINGVEESAWAATLHASTVVRNGTAVLLAGQSGKGKSTLTALLLSQGFHLLADDLTPLHAASRYVYYNPSAVSIKKGAFPVVARHFSSFESYPEIYLNAFKGYVKFLPQEPPPGNRYAASAIIMVNYQAHAETQFMPIAPEQVLQDLIPDSWISPDPQHAMAFVQWLSTLQFYQLTYSNAREAFRAVQSLAP